MKYMEKCGEIFQFFRNMKGNNDTRKALRIRDFLWMLKDFKLINSSLTVKKFLDAVYSDDQQKLEERCFNLDNSVVFLEFYEALLQCSQHFKSETLKSEDESESVKNTMIETVDFKSPSLTKDDEESINAGLNSNISISYQLSFSSLSAFRYTFDDIFLDTSNSLCKFSLMYSS